MRFRLDYGDDVENLIVRYKGHMSEIDELWLEVFRHFTFYLEPVVNVDSILDFGRDLMPYMNAKLEKLTAEKGPKSEIFWKRELNLYLMLIKGKQKNWARHMWRKTRAEKESKFMLHLELKLKLTGCFALAVSFV